jgi:hypothetical protein
MDPSFSAIAAFVHWLLTRLAGNLAKLGFTVEGLPLAFYRHHSFYTSRTDARDRFGTPLEQRYTRDEIEAMMRDAGLVDIRFSEAAPFWCAVGMKRR